jgi:hypothetical protein
MKTRGDYDKALTVVGAFVRSWDPYCLLAEGAPADEFDAEIAKLVAHIPRISDPSSAANVISSVFSASFEAELFTPMHCAAQGEELFSTLLAAGLVGRA